MNQTGYGMFVMEKTIRFKWFTFLCLTIVIAIIFSGSASAAKNRGQAAPKKLIPPELKNAAVYDYFIESGEKEVASIEAKEGSVLIAKPDFKQAYFAIAGDKLYAKDVIFTLAKSRCRFKLVTDDSVSMGASTQLSIQEVVDDRENQSKSSFFGMAKGKAMFGTVHVSRYFKQSMQAETRTAVSGVRGSKFGVEIAQAGGKPLAATPILLADASNGGFIYLAAAKKEKEETGATTVVYGIEGQVEVKSKIDGTISFLNPGQRIEATIKGLSKIFETTDKKMQEFMDSVDVKLQKAAKELEKTTKVVDKKADVAGKALEKKMEKPFGFMEKLGKDLEKKFNTKEN